MTCHSSFPIYTIRCHLFWLRTLIWSLVHALVGNLGHGVLHARDGLRVLLAEMPLVVAQPPAHKHDTLTSEFLSVHHHQPTTSCVPINTSQRLVSD